MKNIKKNIIPIDFCVLSKQIFKLQQKKLKSYYCSRGVDLLARLLYSEFNDTIEKFFKGFSMSKRCQITGKTL